MFLAVYIEKDRSKNNTVRILLKPLHSLHQTRDRRFISSFPNPFRYVQERKLGIFEEQALSDPGNPARQADYYRELLSAGYPKMVVERVESGKFAIDSNTVQFYIQALAQSDQSDKILSKLMQLNQRYGDTLPASSEGDVSIGEIVRAAIQETSKGSKVRTVGGSTGISGMGVKSSPVHVVIEEPKGSTFWKFFRSVSVALIYGFVVLTVVGVTMESSGVLKAGQTNAEVEPSKGRPVTFADVQGCEEAKDELMETVAFLKHPEKFRQLGGKMPKGVLLTGPPGTGKTLLARAVAGEAGVPFFFMSGSEFDEMYVGVGARRVRELFAAARRKSPSIIFIDELDAIGSRRNPKDQAYLKQTLNQLLVELDGFSQTEGVIVMAATNFPELLDKALVRPGRFDRHVAVPLPDVRGRLAILKLHSKDVQLDPKLDLSIIARGTPGFSGAELQNLVNQAAIQASREGSNKVNLKHLEFAKDKIIMGAERKSAVITEDSKRCTAYHEGGHALVALYTPGAMPLHKATIMLGDFRRAAANNSRTRLAPTPTYISSNSLPLMKKNGTPASPATARARSVLPVPGGPVNNTPFGIFPPNCRNFSGCFKNATVSISSSFASSHP